MAYWLGNRSNERFTYRRVMWPSYEEADDYEGITGGSVELSALSELKASGSLSFDGESLPSEHDMVRVYYSFTDGFGDEGSAPIATMFPVLSDPAYDGSSTSGTIELSSVLSVLSCRVYGMPFTVSAGTQAVALAVQLAESVGLRVNNPDPSSYAVKSDHTFEASDSYLDIVDWLLDAAGYSSCWPDAYGIVQMRRYVEPTEREPTVEFADDEESIMYPEIQVKSNWIETVNAVSMTFETDGATLWAKAVNADPKSKTSTVSRGREISAHETVSELDGETQGEMADALMAKALASIVAGSSEVEHVSMSHAWIPVLPNDAVRIDYASAGLSWKGAVTNVGVSLEPGVPCALESRRFVRPDVEYSVTGGVL